MCVRTEGRALRYRSLFRRTRRPRHHPERHWFRFRLSRMPAWHSFRPEAAPSSLLEPTARPLRPGGGTVGGGAGRVVLHPFFSSPLFVSFASPAHPPRVARRIVLAQQPRTRPGACENHWSHFPRLFRLPGCCIVVFVSPPWPAIERRCLLRRVWQAVSAFRQRLRSNCRPRGQRASVPI